MTTKEKDLEWLRHQTEEYHSGKSDICGVVEDLEEDGKLGHGFSSVDRLEEIYIGDGMIPWLTYVNAGLPKGQKDQVCCLL
jgi:hypothetical protein